MLVLIIWPRSNCTSKLQINPLVREITQHRETHNSHTEKINLVMSSRWEPDTKAHCPTDHRSQLNFNFRAGINPLRGVQLGHPVPGGYKYGDLSLLVGGVSCERKIWL
jgi:hypothetical protein